MCWGAVNGEAERGAAWGRRGGEAPPRVSIPPHGRGVGVAVPKKEGSFVAITRRHHTRGRSLQVRSLGVTWLVILASFFF